jgi:type III pantothenate kinase
MDLGNSQAKWALEHEIRERAIHRAPISDNEKLISGLQSLPHPSEVYIASVLKVERLRALCEWMDAHWHLSPVFAQSRDTELGVVNGYCQPEQLGVDRWLALLAARYISKRPLLVVSCGTATTLDAMDRNGRHLGGMILPGLRLFQRCLQWGTDIPDVVEDGQPSGFASDTASGIISGAILATCASVEAAIGRMQQQCGEGGECLLSGGFAAQVAENLSVPYTLVQDLTLQGLVLQAGQRDR